MVEQTGSGTESRVDLAQPLGLRFRVIDTFRSDQRSQGSTLRITAAFRAALRFENDGILGRMAGALSRGVVSQNAGVKKMNLQTELVVAARTKRPNEQGWVPYA